MHPQDIALTFMLLGFIRKNMNNKFLLSLDWNKIDQHMQKVQKSLQQKTRINLDPDRLRWTPILTSPLHSFMQSPFKSHSVESPETPEAPKTDEKTTPDKGKVRQNLNTAALKSPGKKDGKKSTVNRKSPNKSDGTKKGKSRVRAARTRGASSTATTTTDDTSDENEAEEEEEASHVTPRKKRGKNNQDSINSDDEDQNNTQGTTTGKRGSATGNKRTSSRSKTNGGSSKKEDKTKGSNKTNKRGGKQQRGNKMSNQSGECLGMDGGTKNININHKKQKNFNKKKYMSINYHFQDNVKRRKMFLNNCTLDDDDSDDDCQRNENNFELESSTKGIRGSIGDLLYHKRPTSNMKKSTSPKVTNYCILYKVLINYSKYNFHKTNSYI